MKRSDLNLMLLKRFPELKDRFYEETSWQEGIDTGSFIVYEDVFNNYLEENMDLNNEEVINKCFDFIEELANIDDEYVLNLLVVGIFENMNAYKEKERYIKRLRVKSVEIFKRY